MHVKTRLNGYSGDIAVLIAVRNVEVAQFRPDRIMEIVNGCMRDHGLSLAVGKTELEV